MTAARLPALAVCGYCFALACECRAAATSDGCPDVQHDSPGAALLQVRSNLAKPASTPPAPLESWGARGGGAGQTDAGGGQTKVVTVKLQSERHLPRPLSEAEHWTVVLQEAILRAARSPVVQRSVGHGLLLGVIYGFLHVVAPDHLGTLVSLSASAECPTRAFAIGAWWGFGHCLGMVVVAGCFLLMGRLARGTTNVMEQWEHYGDYAIGVSMCLVALYFASTESRHIETRPDGTTSLMRCLCHPDGGATSGLLIRTGSPDKDAGKEGEGTQEQPVVDWQVCPVSTEAPAYGAALRAMREAETSAAGESSSSQRGALLGLFQGVCCPCGLVGISFMANLPGPGLACFAVVFSVVSILGTGLLALSWSCLTSLGCGANVSQLWMYRASYGFTFLLGLCWLLATFYGVVDKLDFTENIGGISDASAL